MNRIFNSVVGKLWATILLLVSFVLFIVTLLLLEFLNNYHTKQAEDSLKREAETLTKIIHDYNSFPVIDQIIDDILDTETNAMVISDDQTIIHSFHNGEHEKEIQQQIFESKEIQNQSAEVLTEMILPSMKDASVMEQYLVLIRPIIEREGQTFSIVMYQSLDVVHRTTKSTTHIVFLSALIAFLLTTFFAFFLSSRITSPLRRMREAASAVSQGNFDTQLPVTQNDEIGELSKAFNTMGIQLKDYVEVIKQEKEQLSSVLTSMVDAVITFNTDFDILVKNPPAEKLLQKWQYSDVIEDGELPPQLIHMLDHVINFAEQVEDEIEMGRQFYAVSISPLYSENSIRGAVAVLRDMTEQHQLDKLRSDFIANVSHELRTPIAMLQGYSEAIIDGVTETEEESLEMVQIILDESKRMNRLVNDLLDLARMESGHLRLYKEKFEMSQLIERMLAKFAQRAKENEVELVMEMSHPSIELVADEDRLEQVLTNLIDNAIRHTPVKGKVTIACTNYDEAVECAVIDTGVGIPEEDIPYIFERFYKADKARTRGTSGTGLGLAIVKNIIDTHEGMIYVKRGKDEGTIFTFVLPKNL